MALKMLSYAEHLRQGRTRDSRNDAAADRVGDIRHKRPEGERNAHTSRRGIVVFEKLDGYLRNDIRQGHPALAVETLTFNPSWRRRLPTCERPVVPTFS